MPAGQGRSAHRRRLVLRLPRSRPRGPATWRSLTHTRNLPSGVNRPSAKRSPAGISGSGRNRVRLLADLVPVDSLIREVREVDDSVFDPIRRAAVLVDAVAYVVALGRNVDGARLAVRPGQSHDDVSTALGGPAPRASRYQDRRSLSRRGECRPP